MSLTSSKNRIQHGILPILFGVAIFLFWWLAYPHALSYQEQYQLFLWTGDYLAERFSVAGGLADYIGEFITQFYYVPWLGALLLSLLFLALQQLTWCVIKRANRNLLPSAHPLSYTLISFLPPLLLLWHMGDESVLLSYPVALVLALLVAWLMGECSVWLDVAVVPVLYWLTGPVAWMYVALRVLGLGWKSAWLLLYMALAVFFANRWLLVQWPAQMVVWGLNYYRIPLMVPALQVVIPVVIVLLVAVSRWLPRRWLLGKVQAVGMAALLVLTAFFAVTQGFDKDKYELIRQDYLIRNERWDDVIERAQKYTVQTPFWSQSVNLALAMKHQLAERQFDFFQSGKDALFMPRTRDLTSMIPTSEVFWHLGMVNSAQRYAFDTQESILNQRKSGRFTKRIAECMMVNGHYDVAAKQLDLLKKSLFYRSWAKEAETYLYNDAMVSTHPVWGRMRTMRFKDNFLFSHEELDKMSGRLFVDNPANKMALEYFMAQMLLNGNVQGFMQYMSWAQQYGGYTQMPRGYQDAVKCIQARGNVANSPYGNYVRRMTEGGRHE